MKYSEFADIRKNTFQKSYDLIMERMQDDKCYNIVELGSSRSFVNGGVPGCLVPDARFWNPDEPKKWDWGAGIFTKVFSENLSGKNFKLYTVDPHVNANFVVSTICRNNKEVIVCSDYSTNFLKKLDFKIDFLYMDHMDICEQACVQHLQDAKFIIENNIMSDNAVILVDDVGIDNTNSKSKYSIPYLLQNGYTQVMHDYQIVLTKN
jgi:hypothetical protein